MHQYPLKLWLWKPLEVPYGAHHIMDDYSPPLSTHARDYYCVSFWAVVVAGVHAFDLFPSPLSR